MADAPLGMPNRFGRDFLALASRDDLTWVCRVVYKSIMPIEARLYPETKPKDSVFSSFLSVLSLKKELHVVISIGSVVKKATIKHVLAGFTRQVSAKEPKRNR